MSHFTGIVFGPAEEIDSKLSRYDENLEVETYTDKTPKELLQWAKDYENRLRDTLKIYSDNKDNSYEQERANEIYKELYETWNNFKSKEDYKHLIEKYFDLDKDGNSLSTYNPESKWDWYVVGGRWNGELLHAGSYDTNQARIEELTQIDTPFCFIDLEGNWHEQGEMGWFGVSSNNKEEDAWDKEFREYLNSVPKDTLITLIDFHI